MTRIDVFALLLALGCGGVSEPGAGPRKPRDLIDGFQSFQRPAEVRAQLPESSVLATIEDSTSAPRGACPRFDVLTLRAASWSHLGVSGQLQFSFVNEVLFETAFFPDSPEKYGRQLRNRGIAPSESSSGPQDRAVTIREAAAYTGRTYVAWTDAAIQSEIRAWLSACS